MKNGQFLALLLCLALLGGILPIAARTARAEGAEVSPPSAAECRVIFDLRGHGKAIDPVTALKGSMLTKPEDPKAEGFAFAGWMADEKTAVLWDFEKTPLEGDLTLFALWKEAAAAPAADRPAEPTEKELTESSDTEPAEPSEGETTEPSGEEPAEPSEEKLTDPPEDELTELPEDEPAETTENEPSEDPAELPEAEPAEDLPHTHTWGEWEVLTEPTAWEAGVKVRTCTAEDCGEEERKALAALPPFLRSTTVDGVVVIVQAPEGIFPEDAELSVTLVPAEEQTGVNEAVAAKRADGREVAASYTFDITVLDGEGNALQIPEGKQVSVSFSLSEVKDETLESSVYHIAEAEGALSAEKLETRTEGDSVTARTGSI